MIIYAGALLWILFLYAIDNAGIIDLSEPILANRFLAFMAMFYLIFFIGLRSAGADTSAYLANYKNIEPGIDRAIAMLFNFQEEENLFIAYGITLKTMFGQNYVPYLFGIAAMSGISVFKILYKYSENYYLSMMLFMLWGTWSWMYNGIRQFWAVSIVFLCLLFIEDNNPALYIIGILIASRIHTSALLMLPVFFIVNGEPWKQRTIIPAFLTAFALIFTGTFLGALGSITEGMDYGEVLSGHYFSSDTGSNPIRTLMYAIPTVLALLNRDTIEREAPHIIKVCVNMSFLCVCTSAIANVTSGIYIGRLPIYFSVYNMILYPWLFCNTDIKERKGWIPSLMMLYVAYFWYENYIHSHPYYYSEILGLRLF